MLAIACWGCSDASEEQGSANTAGRGGRGEEASAGSGGDQASTPSGEGGAAGSETNGAAGAGPVTFEGSEGQTCVCEGSEGGDVDSGGVVSRLSLECYVSALSNCSSTLAPLHPGDDEQLPPFALTRHEGCGRISLGFMGGYGSDTCVYDGSTEHLVGASVSSDIELEPCQTHGITGGEPDNCREGEVCSLSGGDTSCVEACSLDLLEIIESPGPQYVGRELEEDAKLQQCSGNRDRLIAGCGRVTIDRGHARFVYDQQSKLLIGFQNTSVHQLGCDGTYGAPPEACDAETSCSLCEGDDDECSPEQLGAE